MTRRPTISDVASRAGVSNQTVSRVLNDERYVAAATRERVRAAIQELDFRPSTVARALVAGRSRTVGVVTSDTSDFGPTSVLLGLERAAAELGYMVIVVRLREFDQEPLASAVERLQCQGVDGVLVNPGRESASPVLSGLSADVPLVAVEDAQSSTIPVVAVDQPAGAAAATRLLLDYRHNTVAHIAGPHDWLPARRRLEGWRSALEAAGAPIREPLFGDWSATSGFELGRRLAADPELTAIFAANDSMAIGAMRALHLAGRRVPEDVSVVGFDDIPEAQFLTPALTTVRQEFDEIGRQAFRLFHALSEDGQGGVQRYGVRLELVVRESARSAPGSRR